jgi:hypothetical protein
MFRRNGKVLLMTITLLVVPLGGVVLLLYAARLLSVPKLRATLADPYDAAATDARRGSAR